MHTGRTGFAAFQAVSGNGRSAAIVVMIVLDPLALVRIGVPRAGLANTGFGMACSTVGKVVRRKKCIGCHA